MQPKEFNGNNIQSVLSSDNIIQHETIHVSYKAVELRMMQWHCLAPIR